MHFINKLVWSIAIPLMFVNALYFSFRLRFPQLKFVNIFKSITRNSDTNSSLFISLASKLGAGSLAGISFAIYYGGIGTIFWIWISTLFASINCYIENILAIKYNKDTKGPSSYIRYGVQKKHLSFVYSLLAIIVYVCGFIGVQNNTIVSFSKRIINVNPLFISLLMTFFSMFFICKGIKKVSLVCSKIVPFMTILYVILGIFVLIVNIKILPSIFISIIKSAFSLKSGIGGLIYSVMLGVQKSIFATEAGVGTSAMASSFSENKDYVRQGYLGIIEVFFIGFVATITAFMLVLSGVSSFNFSNVNGIELIKYSFFYHFGSLGDIFLLIVLFFFSFSSIITCYCYGELNLKNIVSSEKAKFFLKTITFIVLLFGGVASS